MCMKDDRGCLLAERMAKVETKQNLVIGTMLAMFIVVVLIAFKLLNTQIYMLTGADGLHSVSAASRDDLRTTRNAARMEDVR